MRTGILAKKLGMTRVYNEQRVHNSVTVLEVPEIKVIGQKNKEKDGYDALVLGAGSIKQKKINKPQKEFFSKSNIEPVKKIKEFRVSEDNLVESGSIIMASHFVVGQYVDVKAFSIGKGFAGAMKRHNFGGLRASHGVSISHRAHGSTGHSQDPGKVFKGKKMAGHMGDKLRTMQNIEIIKTDLENELLYLKGSIPGSKNSEVLVKGSVKNISKMTITEKLAAAEQAKKTPEKKKK